MVATVWLDMLKSFLDPEWDDRSRQLVRFYGMRL